MKKRQRIIRPALERQQPVRTWSTLFGGTGGRTKAGSKEPDERTEMPGAPEPIQRSVGLGYQVIEEYIKQGQAFAGLLSGPMTGAGGSSGRAAPQPSEQLFKYATDFASAWLQAVGTMGIGMPAFGRESDRRATAFTDARATYEQQSPQRPKNGAQQPSPEGLAQPLSVAVEIESKRRAKASLALKPMARVGGGTLTIHGLRSEQGQSTIKTVSVRGDTRSGGITISIRVPDKQPRGTYSGLLVDSETSLPLGTLTLDVLA